MTPSLLNSLCLGSFVLLAGCGGGSQTITSTNSTTDITDSIANDVLIQNVDTSLFDIDAIESIETVSCVLSNGTTSECYSITASGFPSDRAELGDFCPQSISDNAESVGKWFDNGVLYDLTGEFVANLDTFYGDSFWQLYDQTTGSVKITDTQEACEAAARPNVDAQYYNHCVECDINYYAEVEGQGVTSTYLIPVTPIIASSSSNIDGNVGVALNGVNLAAAAPTAAILGAYTIAAFDDCVGHVNPVAGYHYHGANHGDGDCPAIAFESDGHAGAFAYAMDGFLIYGMLDSEGNEPTDLDECRGHSDDIRGYHYHTAGAGENAFIGCFRGEVAR